MFGTNSRRTLLGAGALWLAVLPANAENVLRATFFDRQTFTEAGLLELSRSGSVTQTFQAASRIETVMISFSAVCSTSGTGSAATAIEILIDQNKVYPAQRNQVFCSATVAAGEQDGRATHSVITAWTVERGLHNIQVRVVPRNGGTSRIDYLSLLVWN